jgi:hypothetical protein
MSNKKPLPESRICKECGNEFKPKTALLSCNDCVNKKAREVSRLKREEGIKDGTYVPYRGIRPEGLSSDFEVRRKEHHKTQQLIKYMERDEYRIYLHNKLNEIIQNKPLWAFLTRPSLGETPSKERKEAGKGKGKGRPKKTNIDTRNLNWDDYEQWGFNLPEDY